MAKKTDRQLPEKLTHDFIICDNTINRYGWRLLVEGIDLAGFMKNPVLCYQHNTWSVPVGKWENLRIENAQLIGTAVFDANDDDAVKLYWKYKDGYMNACSLNIIPIEESDDPSFLLPGQRYSTITKSELLEVSLVTIPGQRNAVSLSHPDGNEYKLSLIINQNTEMAKEEKTVDQLKAELEQQRKLNAENLVKLHVQRGVVQEGEEDSLRTLALENYDTVNKMLEARKPAEKPTETNKEQLALSLVELHSTRLGLTVDEKRMYVNAATLDYDGVKKVLEGRKGKETIDTFMQGMGSGTGNKAIGEDRSSWTYLEFYKNDPDALALMAKNEPDKFKVLEQAFIEDSRKKGIKVEQDQ